MSLEEPVQSVAVGDDFGLAEHLAAIERMHRDALAHLEAQVRPWAHLWAPPAEPAAIDTEELPAVMQPRIYGAHAEAA